MDVTRRRIALTAAGGLVVLGVGGGVVFERRGYDPDPAALDRVDADDRISVDERAVGYAVRSGPITESTTGLVLYPGGRVDPESYVPTAAELVRDRELLVVVPDVPLDLAVLDSDVAAEAIEAFPAVGAWYVGGHSLGGAMACRYASENASRVAGLVLLAAYCDRDLSDSGLRVLSILGTADGVIDRDAEREARSRLPEDATVVEIEGMVHSQFGAYGPQRGDGEPRIDDREARQRVASIVGDWLDEAGDS